MNEIPRELKIYETLIAVGLFSLAVGSLAAILRNIWSQP